jgi:hypothetical protein
MKYRKLFQSHLVLKEQQYVAGPHIKMYQLNQLRIVVTKLQFHYSHLPFLLNTLISIN